MDVRTEEFIPLVPQEENLNKKKLKRIVSIVSQFGFGFIGLGAGALYYYPAQICATAETCGLWLTKLTSEKIAIGIFTAGGIDFAGINAFFAANSIQTFIEAMQNEPTLLRKVGKGTFIITFALSQNIQSFIISTSTSGSILETAITLGGAAPGSLYGAVGMTENEFSYLLSLTKKITRNLRRMIVDHCIHPTEAELQMRRRFSFYNQQQSQFLKNVNAKWRDLYLHTKNLEGIYLNDALEVLFSYRGQEKTFIQNLSHRTSQILGLGLGVHISIAFVKSSFNFITKYLAFMPLQVAVSSFLSAAGIYGAIKLNIAGVSAILETLVDILSGNSIQSLAFQLRTKTTIGMVGLAFSLCIFSYAVMNMLSESEFPGADKLHDTYRYTADLGMIIYHFGGLMHLYTLLLSNLTHDQKEKFVCALENEVKKFQQMTLEKFITFVENNSTAKNNMLGLQVFNEENDVEQDEIVIGKKIINKDLDESMISTKYDPDKSQEKEEPYDDESQSKSAQQYSWFGSWYSWFYNTSSTKTKDQSEQKQRYSLSHSG